MLSHKSSLCWIALAAWVGAFAVVASEAASQSQGSQFAPPQMSRSDEIETFKLSNKIWYSTMAMAYSAATVCGLRSERWWVAFQDWSQRRFMMNTNRLKLSLPEQKVIEAEADVTWQSTVSSNTCATITARLQELDAMHDRITLGYR